MHSGRVYFETAFSMISLQPKPVAMFKLGAIIATSFLVLLVAANYAASSNLKESTDSESSQNAPTLDVSARSLYKLPKLFSFDYYRQLFKKQYASTSERLVRAKLYLGRAFRAFISAVSYKHRKSNSYLAINEMSDWTLSEIDKTMMDSRLLVARDDAKVDSEKTDVAREMDSPAVDLLSIQHEFENIVKHKDSDPLYKDIAEELNAGKHHIERRDIRSNLRDLNLNDLVVGGGKQIKAAGTKLYNQLEPMETQVTGMIVSVKDNKYLKSVVQGFSSSSRNSEERTRQNLPDGLDIDHRKCLSVPRTQGKCGCCYAFAAIALYEWAYCKATGERIAFSEQYVIDCGDKKTLVGCSCGYTHEVRKFVRSNGLELRNDYPYKAREEECLYGAAVPPESRGSYRIIDEGWDYVYTKSIDKKLEDAPLVINLYVERGVFQEYGGGVDLATNCKGKNKGMHSLLLVGSGREEGEEYWLLRNSFGQRWGESGHYKINKRSDCIIPISGLVIKFSEIPTIERVEKNKRTVQTQNDWKQLFV